MRPNFPTINSYRNNSLDIESQDQQMAEETLILNPEVNDGDFYTVT